MRLDQALQTLGFAQPEIDLYKACLLLGTSSQEELLSETEFPKLTFQAALQSLKEKGMITVMLTNQTEQFQAESPAKLIKFARTQVQESVDALAILEDQKGVLEGQMSDEKPTVRFFEGKEGLKSMLNEFNQMEGDSALLCYSPQHVHQAFSPEEVQDQQDIFTTKNIQAESICFSDKDLLRETTNVNKHLVNIHHFPFSIDLEIYDNKVAIASLVDNKHGVIIESESIANSFRQLHKLAVLGAQQIKKEANE